MLFSLYKINIWNEETSSQLRATKDGKGLIQSRTVCTSITEYSGSNGCLMCKIGYEGTPKGSKEPKKQNKQTSEDEVIVRQRKLRVYK